MGAERHFVRLFSGGIETWGEDPLKSVKCFDPTDTEHSVYEVDLEEELLAAAAHRCATPTKKSEAISLLRIRPSVLNDFNISVGRFEFGGTGFPKWDSRHRNLVADRDQLLCQPVPAPAEGQAG